jgi:hypothetical protein
LCTLCYLCLWIVHSWWPLLFSLSFIYYLQQSVLCLVNPMLSLSLDCPFWISPFHSRSHISFSLMFIFFMKILKQIYLWKYVADILFNIMHLCSHVCALRCVIKHRVVTFFFYCIYIQIKFNWNIPRRLKRNISSVVQMITVVSNSQIFCIEKEIRIVYWGGSHVNG